MKCLNINPDIIYGLLIIIAIIIIAILSIRAISSLIYGIILRKKIKARKEEAYGLLLSRYNGKVLDADSVRFIYEEMIDDEFDYSFEDFLKSFIIYITEKEGGNESKIKEIEEVIRPLLQTERTLKPYSNLEEEERSLLMAIETSSQNASGDVPDVVRFNLDGLSSILKKKQKTLKRYKKINWWSYSIGVLGVVLTIISFLHKPSISEKSINEISKQVDSVLRYNDNTDTIHEWIGHGDVN